MNSDYLLRNQIYTFLKRLVTIVLPGLVALYAVSEVIWGVPNPVPVLGTLGCLAFSGGLLMGVYTKRWDNSEDKYDGVLTVVGNDPDTGIPDLQLLVTNDPNALVEKRTILFKAVDER